MGNNYSNELYSLTYNERFDNNDKNELKRLITEYLKQNYVKEYISTFGIDSALKEDYNFYLKDWSSYKLYNILNR